MGKIVESKLDAKICLLINKWKDILDDVRVDFDELNVYHYGEFYNFVEALDLFVSGKKPLFHKKRYYAFYNKYKEFLEDIDSMDGVNIYYFFSEFFREKEDYDIYYSYYKHLCENPDKAANVDKILNKIIGLGLERIYYLPNAKFEDDYVAYTYNAPFDIFTYLDSIELIPTYENNVVRYKGKDANYMIRLTKKYTRDESEVYICGYEICLNNFDFDPDRIPDKLTVENTYNNILELKQHDQETCDIMRDAVSLGVGLEDIEGTYISLNEYVNSLKTIKDKTVLKEALKSIEEAITKMTTYTDDFILESSADHPHITPDEVRDQKNAYIRKREMSYYDID